MNTNSTFVKTRKLTMRQMEEMALWIKEHKTGGVLIHKVDYMRFIQQYVGEKDGNRKIHQVKVEFQNEIDANRFLMVWG